MALARGVASTRNHQHRVPEGPSGCPRLAQHNPNQSVPWHCPKNLLVERIGRSSLSIAIVCHRDGIERLRARVTTAMMSLETRRAVPLPEALREGIESPSASAE